MFIYRIIIIFLCVFAQYGWGSYSVIPDEAKLKILTPDLSQQQILKLRLDNGLEAIIVSDPQADQSGAVLTARVGSWEDPENHPGVAHFLEHMLFLGTKHYPIEDEYSRFIAEHGGTNNAFTSTDHTSYLFSVQNDAFPEALDRFSSFFKEPLFNPSGVSREMHAVHQEYAMNVVNDDSRTSMILKEAANPNHPFHRFNIGNLETLTKVSQETLKNWYQAHYSANLMRLYVYSALPMDQLKALVASDFEGIENRSLKEFTTNTSILTPENEGKLFYIVPLKNLQALSIVWEIPGRFAEMMEAKPEKVICSVLGHEGKESLLAQLKRENLALSLSCGGYRLSSQGLLLMVDIELTLEGLQKRETVIERVYQTLAMLKKKGIPEYIYQEIHAMDALDYQLQNRDDAYKQVSKYANPLAYEDASTFPEKSFVIEKYDPEAIKEILSYLTPQKAVYLLNAPTELTKVLPDKEEPWFGIKYAVVPFTKETLTAWENVKPISAIDLPPKNPFIPDNVQVQEPVKDELHSKNVVPIPQMLIDEAIGRIYFASNAYYGTPTVYWTLEIRTPQIMQGNTPSCVLGDLYTKALTESLKEISYNAKLGGLEVTIKTSDFGINIVIDGYAEKAGLLWQEIVKAMTQLQITEEQFEAYKDSLAKEYQNFSKEQPYIQAIEYFRKCIYRDYSTNAQKALAISKITLDRFNTFLDKLFQKTYLQGMLYGQITEDQAKELWKTWSSGQPTTPYQDGKLAHPKVINLAENKGPYYIQRTTTVDGNAVFLGIEDGDFSMKQYAAQQTLGQVIGQAFFTEIRTNQQVGYLVYGTADEIEKHLFTIFIAQSTTYDPRDLLARFELFIENYLKDLSTEIPEERFTVVKDTLINILQKPPRNTKEMGELLNKLAFKYDGDFQWIAKQIEGFEQLSYADFITFTLEYLGRSNKKRLAVLLSGKVAPENKLLYKRLKNLDALRKDSTFSRN